MNVTIRYGNRIEKREVAKKKNLNYYEHKHKLKLNRMHAHAESAADKRQR